MIIKSSIKNYKIEFDTNIHTFLKKNYKKNDIIIVDKNLPLSVRKKLKTLRIIEIIANENVKDFNNLNIIILKILKMKFTKKNKIIAFGGGTIQDTCSFISSILFRGVEYYFIPTSLISQCDSCIGGKTSINFRNYKNIIGNFNPPSKILINTKLLESLNKNHYLSGLGEMLHYFCVSSKSDLQYFIKNLHLLLKRNPYVLKILIKKTLKIKKKFIERDEFDTSHRLILNYGHTFGHALEAYTNYKIEHGIAVCMGMNISNFISYKLNYLSFENFSLMESIFSKIAFNLSIKKIELKKYIKILSQDKKVEGNLSRIILSKAPGKMFVKKIKLDNHFHELLAEYKKKY